MQRKKQVSTVDKKKAKKTSLFPIQERKKRGMMMLRGGEGEEKHVFPEIIA